MFFDKLSKALKSYYMIPAVLGLSYILWLLEYNFLCVGLLALFVVVALLFCDDAKPMLCPIFFCSFFLKDIYKNPAWLFYGILIALVVASFIYFTVKNVKRLKEQGKKLDKGQFFYALVLADIAFLLGGVFSNFVFTAWIITLGFCVVVFIIYVIMVNFTEDLGNYLIKLLFYGGLVLALEVFAMNIKNNGGISYLFTVHAQYSTWVGAQNVNVAAIFIGLSVVCSFALGYKNKLSGLYLIISLFLMFALFVTRCRGMLIFMVPAFVALTVFCFIKTPYKLLYGIFTLICIGLAVAVFIGFPEIIEQIKAKMVSKSSGRTGEIWPWCFEKFKNYPLLGYGFISKKDSVPGMPNAEEFVLAHNTILQWLCSLGVIGTLLMCGFYFYKYRLVIKNLFKPSFFLSFLVVVIALSGATDQAAAMDIFVYLLSITLVVAISKENGIENKKDKVKKEKKE